WKKAFPGTVKPKSAISDSLMEHLRYPQDLFKVQRELLTRYHVTNPVTFYSGSEVWQVPDDPTNKGNSVPPYYLSMKMPDQKKQTFSLTTTLTPKGRDNLGAFVAVDADSESDSYGKIRILKLPSDTGVPGPQLVQANFNSDDKIANTLNILKRGDSEIEYGNLLTVPLGGGLLYVEPVYLRGASTDLPLLRQVLVSYGNKTALESSLSKALDVVFGQSEPTDSTDDGQDNGGGGGGGGGGDDTTKPPTGDATVTQALKDAAEAYQDAQDALKKDPQDWTAYGKAQKALKDALDRAAKAEAEAAKKKGQSQGAGQQDQKQSQSADKADDKARREDT
ncbi:UPF0182 family protein, partial [Streptomyces sp. 2MCAF27]